MMKHPIYSRPGTFQISQDLLKDNPEAAMAVLSKMLVVRAEALYSYNAIKYDAYSELFEIVVLGVKIPEYQICATAKYVMGKKEYDISVKKVTNQSGIFSSVEEIGVI